MLARRAVLSLVTAPAEPAIDLGELKKRLRIDHDDDDDALRQIIETCVSFLDGSHGLLGRCLITQTWDERFERFPCGVLTLALSPVSAVASVKYSDPEGVEQTLDPADYEVASDGDRTLINAFSGWPATDARRLFPATVRYTAGYGDRAALPPPLREAIMLHVGALYERRDALEGGGPAITPLGYDDLIAGYRRPSF